ncbi:hypothetical protein Igag_0719 [Ignisphaera aggregans DSM 17230]|uniref:Uncharacterized protein n=1 Tax=Ignisphaera aggregans (strain DSM 17230 / JCM 13409 / AQ1.S1) TaxID=583356 RepID=E0ST72_IGNAA|nr:hypothetical protein Igag_0719 [Ignisphaera aggregans DSM 17230]
MSILFKVRFVAVSHPDTRSSSRRMIYYLLKKHAVETPFGFILLNESAWDRLMYLNERARAEVGRDVVQYIDVYISDEELVRILKMLAESKVGSTSTEALLLKRFIEELEKRLRWSNTKEEFSSSKGEHRENKEFREATEESKHVLEKKFEEYGKMLENGDEEDGEGI